MDWKLTQLDNIHLTRLDLDGIFLTKPEINQLTLLLCQNTIIKELSLIDCGIKMLQTLITGLTYHNTTLQSLDLSGNKFSGNYLINVITDYLRKTKCLTYFAIALAGRDSGFSRDYLIECIDILIDNTVLKSINLASCKNFSVATVELSLCRLFKTNTTLHSIDLSGNMLRDDELKKFACALCKNNTLTRIDLSSVNYTIPKVTEFLQIVSSNSSILNLRLYDPGRGENKDICFGGLHYEKVREYVRRNRSLMWENVHSKVLYFCIALSSLDLPPYVLLEIFDWLPRMILVNHYKKVTLIIRVKKSIQRLKDMREDVA